MKRSSLFPLTLLVSIPAHAAGPLPVPCAQNCTSANLGFQQFGSVAAPITAGSTMTINQTSQTAILNWQSFNINNGYTVNFVQPSATASALNRIWDSNPTTIAGQLNANGQIYLVNQNGIIFANGAQVNVGGLIASSLDIQDSVYRAGYLSNYDLNSQKNSAFFGGSGFIKVDTGAVLNGSKIMLFAPVVENGGSISTSDGQAVLAAGTRVYLQASQDPNLRGVLVEVDMSKINANGKLVLTDNAGNQLLRDPNGNQYYDAKGNPLTSTSSGTLLDANGALVTDANGNPLKPVSFVPVSTAGVADANAKNYGVQNNTVGTVSNLAAGLVASQRGNTTLVGYAVNQQGMISATTSVNQNGSIKLLARYDVAQGAAPNAYQSTDKGNSYYYDIRATKTGVVTIGKNSVTAVTPETSDAATTTDSQGFNPSIVEVMGKTVDVQGSIIAPSGKVNLVATASIEPTVGTYNNSGSGIYQEINPKLSYSSFLNPNYIPPAGVSDGSRVLLESGSLVDVSGSTASVSVARNILTVQLRGTQLADAPLQKNGFLWGKNVYVDIRKGTTLANISSDESQIGRTVAERTASGGQVNIVTTGDAVLNPGSTVNISGGQVNYTGAFVNSTVLISKGVAYDIANASPNLIYDGMGGTVSVNHSKWGVTETWAASGTTNTIWDPGYVQGMSAGSLNILAHNAAVEGNVVSNTVAGIYQRQPYADPATLASNGYQNTWQMLPKGGSLNIGRSSPQIINNNSDYFTNSDVLVQSHPVQTAYALADTLPSTIVLDSGLFSGGLNNLSIYTNGKVTVFSPLNLSPGGSVKLMGSLINILSPIIAPGGSVFLGTDKTNNAAAPATPNIAGSVNVAANISTRGTWVNDSSKLGAPDLSVPIIENGGSISIKSGLDANISAGVTLDASGGGYVDQSGKIAGGKGGNIAISGGIIRPLDQVALKSYGVNSAKGGALAISTAQDVTLGGTGTGLNLSSSFFRSGGFSSYSIAGGTNVTVSQNAVIAPQSQSLILNPDAALKPSGSDLQGFSAAGFLPDWQRNPVSITLAQTNKLNGAITIDQGSSIVADPKATIELDATHQLVVLGTLDSRAGNINLNLSFSNSQYDGSQYIWLGSRSRLLAGGYFLQSAPNSSGLVQGQALSGGNINIAANGGFFAANKGSVMDVSGISANIDLPQTVSGSVVYRTTHVAGDAGSISVSAVDGAFFDGTMNGSAEAGSQAAAGRFSLFLNGNKGFQGAYDTTIPPANSLQSGQWNLSLASLSGSLLQNALKQALPVADPAAGSSANLTSVEGQSYIGTDALARGGFDQVSLKSSSSISLADNVALSTKRSIALDAPLINAGINSALNSAHVTIGNLDTGNQASVAPATGSGSLNVAAQLVDISGNVSISNVFAGVDTRGNGSVNLSSSGDIRLNGILSDSATTVNAQSLQGALRTQGDITLKANQVYTSTLAQFTFSSPGTLAVLPNNPANPSSGSSPVLSAGGSLTLNAAYINQYGVLKAPMGKIALNGTSKVTLYQGSLISVSGEGQTIPFGYIQGGNTWYYSLAGTGTQFIPILDASNSSSPAVAVPSKNVTLGGPNVDVKAGSTVDLSGGGNLFATEFFAGIGGSTNVLDPTQAPANTYAIIPGISGYTPYDPQSAGQYAQSGSKTVLGNDRTVYLSGGNGLAAGYYSLLPASYALLPGAYRVTAVSGYQDLQPGQAVLQADGTRIMAGKFAVAGTGIMDARWSGFAVSSGAIVRTQSEFHDSTANAFFAAQAASAGIATPVLPVDAGQLVVNATGANPQLTLDGTFMTSAGSGGKGAMVDLNGPKFDIYDPASSTLLSGYVGLTTSTLGNLAGFQSLLVGGTRTQTSNGETISVGASDIVVDGVAISGPEIILATNNSLTVKSGSSIQGKGQFVGNAQNITVSNGDGALLRASSGTQVSVTRTNPLLAQGKLVVEKGVSISAQSVLVDATNSTVLNAVPASGANVPDMTLTGNSFSVAAKAIDIGNPAGTSTALALSQSLMGNFQDITLHSYGDINFHGGAGIGGLDANGKHLISTLTLNAQSLNGNDANASVIDASGVTFTNSNGNPVSAMPSGSGSLNVNADNIVLSDGASSIRGFDAVNLNASQSIVTRGTGSLNLSSGNANAHALGISGSIVGKAKSDQGILASGYDIAINPSAQASNSDVGAKLTISGNNILDKGNIVLTSGTLTLHAANTLTLDSGSNTSAAGFAKSISGQTTYAPAGTISLVSDNGNVNVNGTVDVSGASGGGDAGSLNVSAVKGTVSLAGNLKGSAANAQGSFKLDAGSVASLDSLNAILNSGGYTGALDLRIRSGDVALGAGSTVKASSYHLSADAGKIDVFGAINVSGANGGDILLSAANDVTLQSTAQLNASAASSGGNGGKVSLETVNGAVNLNNAKAIDVSGAKQGSVLLRAPQINNGTDVAVNGKVNVSSGAGVTVEGYKNYAASTIGSADVGTSSVYYSDAQLFAGNAAAIASRLGMSGTGMKVLPGIQITSTGDLALSSDWNLSAWRFNGLPGILTLKAAGNLKFGAAGATASLSDGFQTVSTGNTSDYTLTNDSSWSYRLVAGSDSSAANVMAVQSSAALGNSGNVILAGGTAAITKSNRGIVTVVSPAKQEMIRTGTGSIDIAAGGSLDLGNRDSVIYTAGQSVAVPVTVHDTSAAFTSGGGDVNIHVGGDINATYGDGTTPGSAVNQLVTDWLWRESVIPGSISTSTAWWMHFASFSQNIGALGGGNVDISAGGNITSLSAVVPTTGYVDAKGNTQTLGGGNLTVKAGGNINSGIFYVGNGQGTVNSGGSMTASRSDPYFSLYTLLALGQGSFNVSSNGDLNIQTVVNPTIIPIGNSQKTPYSLIRGVTVGYFSTYGSSSGVTLSSLNGNVNISNNTGVFSATSNASATSPYMNLSFNYDLYPGSLGVTALNGSVNINDPNMSMTLFPSTTGSLKLLAGSDINILGQIFMSDVTPFPYQPASPVTSFDNTAMLALQNGHVSGSTTTVLHSGDANPVVIAAGGNITGDNTSGVNLTLPKAAQISAGNDITNLSASVQNIAANDATSITAGRDIVFTPGPDTTKSTQGITVHGPGQLIVQGGRNVNLGQSDGLLTDGNLQNSYLPAQGASITVLAGAGGNASGTQAFISKYISPLGNQYSPSLAGYISSNVDPASSAGKDNIPYLVSYFFDPSTTTGQANTAALDNFVTSHGASAGLKPADAYTYLKSLSADVQGKFAYDFFKGQSAQVRAAYAASDSMQMNAPDLISFVNNHGGNVGNAADAYTAYQGMSSDLRNAFANQVFFNLLRTSGRSAASSGNYSAGYDAISALFPGKYQGDLSLYYSQIKTVRGGDINIFAPGGGVNAGLANPSANGPQKTASQLGIVTVKGGAVNAFVNNDFLVNQSRVFTLQGGNIMMWSSNGNLDAGKGSKTVSSTPPPILIVDPSGSVTVDLTGSVVGSGIRVLLASSNVVPGAVDLYAPSGAINAGDAGIGSAGNIYLGALHVIGADNINFGGVSVGVPVTTTASFGGLASVGSFQGAGQAADDATQKLGKQNDMSQIKDALANFKPLFLSVDVIGLGNQVFGP